MHSQLSADRVPTGDSRHPAQTFSALKQALRLVLHLQHSPTKRSTHDQHSSRKVERRSRCIWPFRNVGRGHKCQNRSTHKIGYLPPLRDMMATMSGRGKMLLVGSINLKRHAGRRHQVQFSGIFEAQFWQAKTGSFAKQQHQNHRQEQRCIQS